MTGASITLKHDAAALSQWFVEFQARAGRLSPAMSLIAGEMLNSTQDRFLYERAPGGRAWERLAASTLRRNPRRTRPAILRDELQLYGSLTSDFDETTATVGTNVPYAAIHQFGGKLTRAAQKRTAWFRIARHGAGKTAAGTRVGGKLRFARASDRAKSLHQRSFDVPTYTIRIPARPFLGFDDADERRFIVALANGLGIKLEGELP